MSRTGPSAARISSGNVDGDLGSIHRDGGQRRAEHRGGFGRMRALVGSRLVQSDRERGDRLAPVPAAKTEHDRRVKPAADVADHRHVAPEPALDRLLEQGLELFHQGRRVVEPALGSRRRGSRGPSSSAW